MRVLLISTYELGHQPLHLASPAARLRAGGHDVRSVDISIADCEDALGEQDLSWADAVAFSVPMHTAMRLALDIAARVRDAAPDTPICFYGLYARVGASKFANRAELIDKAIAGEYEDELVSWVDGHDATPSRYERVPPGETVTTSIARTSFEVPDRHGLPGLDHYAQLDTGSERRLAGYTEATHGCVHRCRHCPLPPVYDGRVRTIDTEIVIADIAQQTEAGARHISFGDADFLNAPRHALRVVNAMREQFDDLTFDVTVKVEHILKYDDAWPEFADAGCLFVVSAIECVSDDILALLDKGHTAADAATAVGLLRRHGIEIRPSLMPFTPWTDIQDVMDICDFVIDNDLVENVDPVQYSIRLLIPDGSLILGIEGVEEFLRGYSADALSYLWQAPDPALDKLARGLATIAEAAAESGEPAFDTFTTMRKAVIAAGGAPKHDWPRPTKTTREPVPSLTESWFCCAEPTTRQRAATT